ncbi:MAG: glycoside hydrolase family 30 protein [Solirubrobacteraceae bacterium]
MLLGAGQATASTQASAVQTTANLRYALTRMPAVPFVAHPAAGAPVIAVNGAVREQSVIGLGGAMTDTSAWLLYDELSPAARVQAMQDLFTSQGINLNYVRIPMGASDFTRNGVPYTYDDMPAGQSDPTLAHFSIAHDQAYILPALRDMLQMNPNIVTFANPWTAPPWMKGNDSYSDLGMSGSVAPADYPTLAQYFVKFLQAYQQAGVPVANITPMNEPASGAPFPATNFLDAEPTFVADDLAPALKAAGLNTRIWALDSAGFSFGQSVLSSAAAADFAGVAFHCYGGMGYQTQVHDEFPNMPIIMNECSPGITPYSSSEVVIDAMNNWASAVQLWNLALDTQGGPVQPPNSGCGGCTGIITVDKSTHQLILNRNYYEFGQASKFIAAGAVRLATNRLVSDFDNTSPYAPHHHGVTPGVDAVALQNPDGQKVLLAYNSLPHAKTFAVDWDGRYLNYTLPSQGTVTLIWS